MLSPAAHALRCRLRTHTRGQHAQLELHPIARGLAAASLSLREYLAVLDQLSRAYAWPAAATLGAVEQEVGLRLEALRADLDGRARGPSASPELPAPRGPAFSYGWTWVLLGSSMGARVITPGLVARYGARRCQYYRHAAGAERPVEALMELAARELARAAGLDASTRDCEAGARAAFDFMAEAFELIARSRADRLA